MWYLIAGLGWVWLRRRQGKPILPDFLSGIVKSDPFQSGAILVPTPNGVAAIPADTPAIHPAVAASQGLLSRDATMNLASALARVKVDPNAQAALTSGDWGMFDPDAGVGPDMYIDELGQPRSNSMSRRWSAR